MNSDLLDKLESFTENDWTAAVEAVVPSIHKVDQNAVRVWFKFFPLDLVRHLEGADDLEAAMKAVKLQGDFGLLDKIDTSHRFLYGHRYWPEAKKAVIARADSPDEFTTLPAEIKRVAEAAAADANADVSLTTSIAAVALMTLVQAGYDELKDSPGEIIRPEGPMSGSADSVVKAREKDDSQGLFGFLKTVDKKFSVDFEAANFAGRFPVINDEELTSAAQKFHARNWRELDERCWDGPIPIECTAASCGTCWVGVLAGEEKLTDPPSRERNQMKLFGYGQDDSEKPVIRLACQARALGNVTIVIPPWNAFFGKEVRQDVGSGELEPVTTSAKKLRETIASAISTARSETPAEDDDAPAN